MIAFAQAFHSSVKLLLSQSIAFEKIEKINSEYEEGNFDECEDILDLCFYIIDDMKEDNNTQMIKQQLDNWKHKLED